MVLAGGAFGNSSAHATNEVKNSRKSVQTSDKHTDLSRSRGRLDPVSRHFKEVLHTYTDPGGNFAEFHPKIEIQISQRLHFRFSISIAKMKHWIIAVIFRYWNPQSVDWSMRNRMGNLKIFLKRVTGAQFSIVNTNAIIGHDAKIGQNVTVAPAAFVGGKATVGNNSLIGPGAVVLENRLIGTVNLQGIDRNHNVAELGLMIGNKDFAKSFYNFLDPLKN